MQVDELVRLSLNRPVRLLIDSTKATVNTLIQEFIRVRKHREEDRAAILVSLCMRHFQRRCIIFFRSKVSAHQMKIIFGLLGLKAAELHGNLSQEQVSMNVMQIECTRLLTVTIIAIGCIRTFP